MGYTELKVVPDGKRLETKIKTNASSYEPRQQVEVSINTQVRGKGVPAEVVLMAVDEGVLALSNYQTPDLFDFFYGGAPISVFTMDNRSYVIGQRNFGEKGENRGGGGALASKLGGTDLRSRFLFTPYYAAAVHTDSKGRAKVSFELPDNLTTFRIMAVSLTPSEFGQAQSQITVSKPVMLTPSLPRFARENDRFACGVIVHNYKDNKGDFTVQASAAGNVQLEDNAPQHVKIPKGSSQEVLWKCRAVQSGKATLSFAAKGRYQDGLQNELVVSTPEQEQTLALYAATQKTQDEVIAAPANVNKLADNRVSVSVASTALLQLKGALSYLLDYPYDCLEQQLSKATVAVTAAGLVKDFKLADNAQLRRNAQNVLNNLGSYQHASGGFGYWPGSMPDPYVTAYALDIALQAKQAGFDVPTKRIEQAVTWLENAFSTSAQHAFIYTLPQTDTTRAYSVYVLTRYGKNTQSAFNTLYAKRTDLPSSAVAYLLLAAREDGRNRSIQETLAQQLLDKVVHTPTAAYVDQGAELPWLHENNVTATAQALRALLVSGLAPDFSYQLAAWLVGQLNAQGHWNDTYSNALALRALQQYYAMYEKEVPGFTATVKAQDKTLLSASFAGRSLEQITQQFPFAAVYDGSSHARFTFEKQGTGTLYYTLAQHYTPAAYNQPVDAGFSVTRTISTLDGKPATQILTGERYKVTLHIKTPATRSFVVAQDFIPAGFTLVNTTLATESVTQAQLLEEDNIAFTHTQQYEDRIYGYTQELPAGEHRFSYLVTAIAPGSYVYPAAWASQMYAPEVFGRNTTSTLVIE